MEAGGYTLLQNAMASNKRLQSNSGFHGQLIVSTGASTARKRLWALRQGGDLRDALGREYRDGTHVFDWHNKGQDVALAIAQGLHFLHHSNVIHR